MSDRFYTERPLAPGPVSLTGPEAHHLAAVCRLRPGDRVCLFNGDGREYPAVVVDVGRHDVGLDVTGVEQPVRELGYRVEVAAPLPKGDRGQFLVEKLTELGVTHFVPLETQRSVVHPRESKLEKLVRHVVEASKQCGRNTLLDIAPTTDWHAYAARPGLPADRVLAHPSGTSLPVPRARDVALAVGPEGGFSDDEVDSAMQHGWRVVSLGPRILRVETAAVVLAVWASSPASAGA